MVQSLGESPELIDVILIEGVDGCVDRGRIEAGSEFHFRSADGLHGVLVTVMISLANEIAGIRGGLSPSFTGEFGDAFI